MKKQYWSVLLIGLFAAGTLIPLAYADHGKGGGCAGGYCMKSRGHGSWGDKKKFDEMFFKKAHFILEAKDKIGLSEEQAQAIKNLKIEMKKNYIREKAEIRILELEIKAKLHESKLDVAAIQPLVEKKYEAKKAMALSFLEAYAKLKGTLNDKQVEALKALKQQYRQGFSGGKA